MKKKDIELFSKTFHDVKTIIALVKLERDKHHEEMEGLLSQLFGVVDELHELIDDLIDGNDKEATK